jgi:hypothetical protein
MVGRVIMAVLLATAPAAAEDVDAMFRREQEYQRRRQEDATRRRIEEGLWDPEHRERQREQERQRFQDYDGYYPRSR